MKKYLIISLLSLLVACGENKESTVLAPEETEIATETIPAKKAEPKTDGVDIEKKAEMPVAMTGGRYRKVVDNQPATDCNCNCIDLNFGEVSEFCILKDKVYISARCEKTGENTAELYFVGASRDEGAERPFPWKDFDTDTPVANITFQPDGTAELDWIGFKVDGQIATDYAIYGKKTLEGTYKKD